MKPPSSSPTPTLNKTLYVRWDKFLPGTSFFVPCVDRMRMSRRMHQEARRLKFVITTRAVIENGVYGLRVWRNENTI